MYSEQHAVHYDPISSQEDYTERRAAFEARAESPGANSGFLMSEYVALKDFIKQQVTRLAADAPDGRPPLASEARQMKAHAAEASALEGLLGRGLSRAQSAQTAIKHAFEARGGDQTPLRRQVARMPSLADFKNARIGNNQDGGYLVIEQSGAFHDALRPQTVVLQMNPRILDMESTELLLPGMSAGSTVYTPGEGATVTASTPSFQRIRLSARKYACRTVASSELLADSNPSAREIIAADHARQIAARLDKDMLQGNGPAGMTGLRQLSSVTKTALGTGNGAAATLDDVADLLYRLERDNANRGRIFLVMHPRTWNALTKIQDLQDRYQLSPDPTAAASRSLFGVPVLTSSQISLTETVGTSSDCSYIIAVDADQLVVGRRKDVGVMYDPYSESATDEVVIQTTARYDFALLQGAAAQVLTGVRT